MLSSTESPSNLLRRLDIDRYRRIRGKQRISPREDPPAVHSTKLSQHPFFKDETDRSSSTSSVRINTTTGRSPDVTHKRVLSGILGGTSTQSKKDAQRISPRPQTSPFASQNDSHRQLHQPKSQVTHTEPESHLSQIDAPRQRPPISEQHSPMEPPTDDGNRSMPSNRSIRSNSKAVEGCQVSHNKHRSHLSQIDAHRQRPLISEQYPTMLEPPPTDVGNRSLPSNCNFKAVEGSPLRPIVLEDADEHKEEQGLVLELEQEQQENLQKHNSQYNSQQQQQQHLPQIGPNNFFPVSKPPITTHLRARSPSSLKRRQAATPPLYKRREAIPPPILHTGTMSTKSSTTISVSSSTRRDRISDSRDTRELLSPLHMKNKLHHYVSVSVPRSSPPQPIVNRTIPTRQRHRTIVSVDEPLDLVSQSRTEGEESLPVTPSSSFGVISSKKMLHQSSFSSLSSRDKNPKNGHGNPRKASSQPSTHKIKVLPVDAVSDVGTSKMSQPLIDQRTVRLLCSNEFDDLIKSRILEDTSVYKIPKEFNTQHAANSNIEFIVQACVSGINENDFDVVFGTKSGRSLIVYNAFMESDFKTKVVRPSFAMCDTYVDEPSWTSQEVHTKCLHSHIVTAKNRGNSCAVRMGANTMDSRLDFHGRIIYDVIESMKIDAHRAQMNSSGQILVQCVEMIGDQCVDMLGYGGSVRVTNAASCPLEGAVSHSVEDVEEYLQIMESASNSSQSSSQEGTHIFVTQIWIQHAGASGSITIIEILGSHEKVETEFCGVQEFDTLFKVRSGKMQRHQLSQLPKNPFLNFLITMFRIEQQSSIRFIAQISTKSSATEHTLNILHKLQRLITSRQACYTSNPTINTPRREATFYRAVESDLALPRQWTHSELVDWIVKKRLISNDVPTHLTGRAVMKMSKKELKETFYGLYDDERANRLFVALRAENDRIARLRVKRRLAKERYEIS